MVLLGEQVVQEVQREMVVLLGAEMVVRERGFSLMEEPTGNIPPDILS